MKAALALLMVASPVIGCDWTVSKRTDPMTDKTVCSVSSPSAKVGFYRYGNDRPNVVVSSAYTRPWIQIRIDDNEAISLGDDAYTRDKALTALLPQIATGQRIRTSFRDYPVNQQGDAAICDLVALLDSCTAP